MPTRRPCSIPSGLILALLACEAPASEQNADIVRCREAPAAEARINCLEDAVRRLSGTVSTDTAAAPEVTERVADVVEPSLHEEAAAEEPAAVSSAPSVDDELDRFGEEQLPRRKPEKIETGGRYAAHVTSFTFVGRNKLQVRLENGQLWRQNNSDRPNLYRNLRDVEAFDVEMWRTARGTYRMHIPEAGRTIRIERIE